MANDASEKETHFGNFVPTSLAIVETESTGDDPQKVTPSTYEIMNGKSLNPSIYGEIALPR